MEIKLKRLATPHKLKFVEDAESVKKLIDECYEKVKPQIIVNGFRKGNVPRDVAEKQPHFDKYRVYQTIFDILYKKAVEQQGLKIVDASNFEVMGAFEYGESLSMQATVYLKPTVIKFNIDDVKVSRADTVITQQMVDDQINVLQNTKAIFTNVIDVDYKAKKGDVLIIDFAGKCEGKAFAGGTANNFRYVIGETRFIEGFEEQILNIKLNETNVVKVTFPETYHEKSLKGKAAEFTVTVRKIDSKTVRSIEEMAAAENKSIEEYRKFVFDKLVEDYKKIDDERYEADVLSQCVLIAEIQPIPDSMVEYELANEWNQLLYRMSMSEEEFLKKNKSGKDVFYAQKRLRVEKALEIKMFLDHICEKYNITASEEEVQKLFDDRFTKLNKTEEEKTEIKNNLKKKQNYSAGEMAVKHEKATKLLVKSVKNIDDYAS
jgi:trigger factor